MTAQHVLIRFSINGINEKIKILFCILKLYFILTNKYFNNYNLKNY